MNKLQVSILSGVLLLLAPNSMIAQVPQVICKTSAVPTIARAEGKAELVGDILLVCTGGYPTAAASVNISVFLNTNITSNLTGPAPDETEAFAAHR